MEGTHWIVTLSVIVGGAISYAYRAYKVKRNNDHRENVLRLVLQESTPEQRPAILSRLAALQPFNTPAPQGEQDGRPPEPPQAIAA